MILSDIRRYLIARPAASLSDIAMHFDSTPDAIRGMLDIWVRKGKVKKNLLNQNCSSGCNKCPEAIMETYSWSEEGLDDVPRTTPRP